MHADYKTIRPRAYHIALPHDGGGLGGGDATSQTAKMKKHPPAGAHVRSRTLRQNMTEAEKAVWAMLRSRQIGGHRFRRQVPLGQYIADFVCHEARLIIEIDGGQHGASSGAEIERTRFLESEGYRILRFWNNDVLEN